MATNPELKIKISADAGQATKGLKDTEKALTDVDKAAKDAGENASIWTKNIGDLQSVLAAAGLGAFAKEVFDAGLAAERLQKGLEAATGSSEDAQQALGYIKEEANRLGIEVNTLGNAYINLAASARSAGIDTQTTQAVFSAVSEGMAILGKSTADTEGALLALGQMMSKGKVSAEELRGQLGERLPGAMDIAAKALGVTTGKLDEMLAQGEVIADADFFAKFAEQASTSLGLTGGQVDTTAAALGRLQNTATGALVELSNSVGSLVSAGDVLDGVSQAINILTIGFVTLKENVGATGRSIGEFARFLSGEISFSEFTANVASAFDEANKNIAASTDRLMGLDAQMAKAGVTAEALGQSVGKAADGLSKGDQAAQQLTKSLATLDAQFKTTEDLANAMADVATSEADARVAVADAAQQQAEVTAKLTGSLEDEKAAAEAGVEVARQRTDASLAAAEADRVSANVAQAKYEALLESYKKITDAGGTLTAEQQKLQQETWAQAQAAENQAQSSEAAAGAMGAMEAAARAAALTIGDQSEQVTELELAYVKAKGAAEAAADQLERYTKQQAEMARLNAELKKTQEEIAAATDKTSIGYVELKARESDLIQEQALLNQSMEKNKITQEEVNKKQDDAKVATAQYIDAINDKIEALGREVAANERQQDIADKLSSIHQESIRQQIDLAKRKGDTAKVTELQIKASKDEAAALYQSAQAEENKADTLRASLEEIVRKAEADGVLTAAEKEQIATAEHAISVAELEAQSRRQAANAANEQAKAVEEAAQAAEEEAKAKEEAAEAAAQAARENTVYTTSIETLIARYGTMKDRIDEVAAVYKELAQAEWGAGRAFANTEEMESAISGLIAKAEGIIRLRDATAEWIDKVNSGTLSLKELEHATWFANGAAGTLGDEELEPLRDAIQDAKDRMQDFADSAQDTLTNLRKEYLQLQGDKLAVLDMEYELDRLEIEEQLADAKRRGNAEEIKALQEALDYLKKIYDQKRAIIEQDQKANGTGGSGGTAGVGGDTGGGGGGAFAAKNQTTTGAAGAPSNRTVTLRFGSAKVRALDDGGVESLIDELERAGLVAQ